MNLNELPCHLIRGVCVVGEEELDVSFLASLMEDRDLDFKVSQMPFADKFQLHIYAALAEQERDFISQRTKAALAAAKARGVQLGNPQNLKRTNEKRHQLALARAQQLASVVVPLRQAGQTLQQIANALNGMGLTTARGGRVHPYSVSLVLQRVS